MTFSQEEINLMCIYDTTDRATLSAELKQAFPYIDDVELQDMAAGIAAKLDAMTDEEYSEIEFSPFVMPEDLEREDL